MRMQFRYVAYTLADGVLTGTVDGPSESEAHDEVVRQGYKPLRLSRARHVPSMETMFPSLSSVGTGEIVLFARQLATMLGSGGSLLRALEMLEAESQSRAMRRTLEAVRKAVDEGASLSAALTDHPRIFGPLFLSVVEVGEHTGRIGPALEQLADILEREQEAKQKAIRTMMYPAAIIGLSLVTMGVLMTVALPPLLKVFDQMGADVPVMTRVAMNSMGWIRTNILNVFLGSVALFVLFTALRRLPRVRVLLDAGLLRAPLIGSFIVAGELARFSRTNALLLESGVSLAMALQLSIAGCNNQALQRAFADGEESLLSGHGLTKALKEHTVFPSLFVELLAIGEETNSLRQTMRDAAETYQKQLEQRLNGLLGFLEPASTVIVGGIVGFIAFSMFVPIYAGLNTL